MFAFRRSSAVIRSISTRTIALPRAASACVAVSSSSILRQMASSAAASPAAPPVTHDASSHQFVFQVPEGKGHIDYEVEKASGGGKEVMNITHTIVEPGLRGRGVAGKLADAALAHARSKGMAVRPSCSYISDTFLPGGKGEAANWTYAKGDALAFPRG